MEKLERFWKRIPKSIRKSLVLIFGSTVVLTGLVLLILPGPGWAAIFLGFAILATEFAIAERARDWMVGQLKKLIALTERRVKKLLRK